MNRALLLLALALAGLFAWDRALGQRAADRRSERSRVGHVLPPERREGLPVAAVRIEIPGDATFLFGRVGGAWRSLDPRRAHADPQVVSGLIDGLSRSEGMIVSREPADAEAFGLGLARSIVVSLCGPKVLDDPGGDVLEAFVVGASVPGGGGAFVRRRGHPEIWSIDADPRATVEDRLAPHLPPLIDRAVVPSAWEGWKRGLTSVAVQRPGAEDLRLARRLRAPESAEPPNPGEPPFYWVVADGTVVEHRASEPQATAFTLFLRKAPIVDLIPPADAEKLQLSPPTAVVVLTAEQAPPLTLQLGTPLPSGHVPVFLPALERLAVVTAEVARLLAPAPAFFVEAGGGNPWDPYLREPGR